MKMKSPIASLVSHIVHRGKKRDAGIAVRSMGRDRTFIAYDWNGDTFAFEEGITDHIGENNSVLMVEQCHLQRGRRGFLMTVTSGNHAVAAMPLLDGRLWDFPKVPQTRRGKVMTEAVLCANIVGGHIEISQRDVPWRNLVRIDGWLLDKLGLSLADVVMGERNDLTLEHYRSNGQEWRIRPLAWTHKEMSDAIAFSRKRIATSLRYYHSMKGVHFLGWRDFDALAQRGAEDWDSFMAALKELTGVFEGNMTSFTRLPKIHGHHEIEFFGLSRGRQLTTILPPLELLVESIVLGKIGRGEALKKFAGISQLWKSYLLKPSLADEKSDDFIETMYIHLTGEVYSVMGDGSSRAFDDRRTALPGATFVAGRPQFHPGADSRTKVLLSNLRSMLSRDEFVEYANVYELRDSKDENVHVGEGLAREVVYKTNRRPKLSSLVEKRLSHAAKGYPEYVLTRVNAFRSLGIGLLEYRLMRRRLGEKRTGSEYFIRGRCEGWPLDDIPPVLFQQPGEFGGADTGEDARFVTKLAFFIGDAAAQNLAMKKYNGADGTCYFNVGKEIYHFSYDISLGRLMPDAVRMCSVRGALGWPDISYDESNLDAIIAFYSEQYVKAFLSFAKSHPTVSGTDVANAFMEGFEYRTLSMEREFSLLREAFESFDPKLPKKYDFNAKWRFALWTLERQARRLPILKERFIRMIQREERI